MFKITTEALDPRALEALLVTQEDGAVATFQGVVRIHSRGKVVSYLEYDAYAPMAEKVMAQIAQEVADRWDVRRVGVWHRTGRLEIGETSMVVVVASPHRKEAFEACRYVVDRVKAIVPIWKKEVWEDGESWVEGETLAGQRQAGASAKDAGLS
ncbi:MAG: molybdenum cofactor biosynthesis protein MoaE [Chloroflexi bacterium]|nr:molybdenum cofactor biosynthesis protein MoaE [Chloroflexota bacterium]